MCITSVRVITMNTTLFLGLLSTSYIHVPVYLPWLVFLNSSRVKRKLCIALGFWDCYWTEESIVPDLQPTHVRNQYNLWIWLKAKTLSKHQSNNQRPVWRLKFKSEMFVSAYAVAWLQAAGWPLIDPNQGVCVCFSHPDKLWPLLE